jgi:WD40 repeat protein
MWMRTHKIASMLLVVAALGTSLLSHSVHAQEQKVVATFKEPAGPTPVAFSVAFSPDGKTLAAASAMATRLWDVASGKNTATLKEYVREKNLVVVTLAFSPDGKTLACGRNDDAAFEITLWDVATCKERATLQGHRLYIKSLAFSPDGKTLASASEDRTIRLWDVGSGKHTGTLQGPSIHGYFSVRFSPDGKTLAAGNGDGGIEFWVVASGNIRAILKENEHGAHVYSVDFSPDGKILASVAAASFDDQSRNFRDTKVKLWEVATRQQRASFPGMSVVVFSADGKTLVSHSQDNMLSRHLPGSIKLSDVATSQKRFTLKATKPFPGSFYFGALDGKTLATVSYEKLQGPAEINLWHIPAGKLADNPVRSLSPKDLDALWTTLAGDDAQKAYQAINTLVVAPEQAIGMIKERLRPASEPDAQEMKQLNRLIDELGSNQFAARQRAREELEKLDERAETALRKKLADKPALEIRRQIEQLLAKIERLTPERSRALRGIEVLEHIGSSEARQVLQVLAKGSEGSRTTEAKASLDRLNKRAVAE